MEEIFSSNSKEVIQKQLNICLDNKLTLKSKDELDFYFDVSKITIWIQENKFKRRHSKIKTYFDKLDLSKTLK